jgi:hypothetical protein
MVGCRGGSDAKILTQERVFWGATDRLLGARLACQARRYFYSAERLALGGEEVNHTLAGEGEHRLEFGIGEGGLFP